MALFDTIRAGASGTGDYEIERSLRFNNGDSPNLTRTPSSASNRRTYTISAWVKRSSFGAGHTILSQGTSGSDFFGVYFPSDQFSIRSRVGGSDQFEKNSTGFFRDLSAWMHVLVAVDTTQSTAEDRAIGYLNGVRVTDYSANTIPAQNTELNMNTTETVYIGSFPHCCHWDGYIAELQFIDGQALTPSSFAETDAATGEYKPIKYTGTYGTNGFYLNFSDNSGTTATTLGKDLSGNGNNFTPNNFSVSAGKDDDSSFDTPTNNFPTLSPVDRTLTTEVIVSNGNLRWQYNYKPASKTVRATMALPSTGKIYMEWENEQPSSQSGRMSWGLVRYTSQRQTYDYQAYNHVDYINISFGGSIWNGTTHLSSPSSGWPSFSFYTGERAALAIDCSNGKWWLGKVASNGSTTWYANDGGTDGDPAGGTNESATLPSFTTATEWMPFVGWHDGGAANSTTYSANINFGNHSFLGTVPTGFEKLCSNALPDPTIKLSDKYFDSILYTGNDSTNNITGLNFSPDWIWIKQRNGTFWHQMFDTVRGVNRRLYTNRTDGENLNDPTLTAFNSDGFTLGDDDGGINGGSNTYVAWCWEAGSSTVTNTNGSISSSVRASTTAGFSIATWTSNGSGSPSSFGHGLGVKPDFLIIKSRGGSGNWQCWSSTFSNATNNFISLNLSTGTQTAGAAMWGTIDSTVVNFRHSANSSNGDDMIGYFFSNVEGFSKSGKYTGNGLTNGTFVFTGFRPAFLIVKNTNASKDWLMFDNKRSPFNVINDYLFPSLNEAEGVNSTTIGVDFTANGFKWRGSSSGNDYINSNGQDFIYLAFAESPFKYARAR